MSLENSIISIPEDSVGQNDSKLISIPVEFEEFNILKKFNKHSNHSLKGLQYGHICARQTYLQEELEKLPKLKNDGSNYNDWKKNLNALIEINPFLPIIFNEQDVDQTNEKEMGLLTVLKKLFIFGVKESFEDFNEFENLSTFKSLKLTPISEIWNCKELLETIDKMFIFLEKVISIDTFDNFFASSFISQKLVGDFNNVTTQAIGRRFINTFNEIDTIYLDIWLTSNIFGPILSLRGDDGRLLNSSKSFKKQLVKKINEFSIKDSSPTTVSEDLFQRIKVYLELFKKFNEDKNNYANDKMIQHTGSPEIKYKAINLKKKHINQKNILTNNQQTRSTTFVRPKEVTTNTEQKILIIEQGKSKFTVRAIYSINEKNELETQQNPFLSKQNNLLQGLDIEQGKKLLKKSTNLKLKGSGNNYLGSAFY
ncbi:hypothetical protein TBLA_0D02830 [Henningerozyma blattae CBS 6284]|uniref:Uncharacterized protein n=1 Tax=Henningerozyma blattae (strain ATCC 34711 / CBS 6284 / DSM 70876 / NBRC 10599 / NRRL Y-10934 / UCD 77-7) TaxID=1071380 RepID=I2H332_HENB6|nr:hypothetical protein TBLA_0D02830 [Tetrapisispora blattae CBS 6284]CCH60784.1 hypothetical protein TBLA_0D02830 [Tetrapisispora blattae CBS 6284]